ncbi:MAG: tetratricopeptide repeat protein [Candidatus Ratteibacteria bacterium]
MIALCKRFFHSQGTAILFLLMLSFLAYSRTFGVPFVLDDIPAIRMNPAMFHPSNFLFLWKGWPTRIVGYWSFAINYYMGGFQTPGYHLVNLLIHIGSVLTVRWCVLLLFSSPAVPSRFVKERHIIAFFTAMIFSLHPVQTQAVTYIYQRFTSLASFFILLSVACWLRSRLSSSFRQSISFLGCSFLFALLASFTKEIALAVPLLIGMLELFFFTGRRRKWFFVILCYIGIVSSIPLTMSYTGRGPVSQLQSLSLPGSVVHEITPARYFFTQGKAALIYARLLLFPVRQNLDYDISPATCFYEPKVLAGFGLILLILLLGILSKKKNPFFFAGIVWFFLAIGPQSSVVPKPDLVVEHRLYLPLFGYALLLSSLPFLALFRLRRFCAVSLLLLLILFYGVLTVKRNEIWRDPVRLWSDVIAQSPAKARPWLNRGVARAERGDAKGAMEDYQKAISRDPSYLEAYISRGSLWGALGKYREAVADFEKVLEVRPNASIALNNRGVAYASMGKREEARDDFSRAILYYSGYAEAYKNRAILSMGEKDYSSAVKDFSSALALMPRSTNLLLGRALALLGKGDIQAAKRDVERMRRLGVTPPASLVKQLSASKFQ